MFMANEAAPPGASPSPCVRRCGLLLLIGLVALALCAAPSLSPGARSVPLPTVVEAVFTDGRGHDALLTTGPLLPRIVEGLAAVGLVAMAALGGAGPVARRSTRTALAQSVSTEQQTDAAMNTYASWADHARADMAHAAET
ncbi:hypothetical protein ACQEU8_01410 [Streptomyces sp. CA-250714]|uniref:hypothetical protein n=1 Tax=Streptomyces sp. CA-250714 TaxID=3240060 RepID=UPI003D92937F